MKGVIFILESKDLIRHVKITTRNNKEKMDLGNYIHGQLVGKPDYVNNYIILNIDAENEINLYIFEGCKEIPDIHI